MGYTLEFKHNICSYGKNYTYPPGSLGQQVQYGFILSCHDIPLFGPTYNYTEIIL